MGSGGVEPCHPVVSGHTCLLVVKIVKNQQEMLCLFMVRAVKRSKEESFLIIQFNQSMTWKQLTFEWPGGFEESIELQETLQSRQTHTYVNNDGKAVI